MPREVFVAGQILTAAEMNIVSDQTVMTFAGTAARGSAIPTPSEGMAAYLSDSNIVSLYDGAAWKNSLGVTGGILQVVQTVKTDTFTSSSTTMVDITGLSVSITPSSASSRVLVLASVAISGQSGTTSAMTQLVRGSTTIAIGDAGGTRTRLTIIGPASGDSQSYMVSFLDSPATTSSTTYKFQSRSAVAGAHYVNRNQDDSDAATTPRGISTIMVMEVAG
jgi:hypothetical protein